MVEPNQTQSGSCCKKKNLVIVLLASLIVIAGAGAGLYFSGFIFILNVGRIAWFRHLFIYAHCPHISL